MSWPPSDFRLTWCHMKNHLLKLGFSDKESEVFLSLIRLGPTAASTLARTTHIKRSSIYDILNGLQAQDMVGHFKKGHILFYHAEDPKKMLLHQRTQLETAQTLVEELEKMPFHSDLQVVYYKGLDGMKELYSHILEVRPKELLGWVDLDSFYQALDPDFETRWTKKRIASDIHVRLLMQDSPLAREFQAEDQKSKRQTLLLKGNSPFATTCFLYDSYLVFFDTRTDVIGIRLHNPGFFQMQKSIFEMAWEGLKKR
jgi:sugar-specific transcriptional regulator TrmB